MSVVGSGTRCVDTWTDTGVVSVVGGHMDRHSVVEVHGV